MYKTLLQKIKEYDQITVFRHQRPDGDAVFSALALVSFLRENFPEKKIKTAGNDLFDLCPVHEPVPDDFIRNGLAIVVDTSNAGRVDDQRFADAEYVIKIDHHPVVENYGKLNIADPSCAAAAEVLTDILFSAEFEKYEKSETVCRYLYCGIISDTINFKTTNTTSKTLKNAAKLVEHGNLLISDLADYVFDINSKQFQKVTSLRTYLQIKDHFGYILLNKEDLQNIGMTAIEAKNQINEFGSISDLNVWAFACQEDTGYNCSVRSKRGYIINDICREFGGGGHPNAAAAKDLSYEKLMSLFDKLVELSTNK